MPVILLGFVKVKYTETLHSTLIYSLLLDSTLLSSPLLYSILLYSIPLHSTLLSSALLYFTLPYSPPLYWPACYYRQLFLLYISPFMSSKVIQASLICVSLALAELESITNNCYFCIFNFYKAPKYYRQLLFL